MTVPQTAHAARRLKLSAHSAFALLVVVLLALVSAVTYAAHEVYEGVAAGNGIELFDQPAMHDAVGVRGPAATAIAVGLTHAAGRLGTPILVILVLAALWWRRRDWTPAVVLATGLTGSLAITVVGKNVTARARPPRQFALPPFESSPSFPSGHTLNATVLATLVVYLVLITVASRWARATTIVVAALFAVGVGLSRVYLGQHWLTDVIAGFLIGLAWAFSVVLAHRVWLELRHGHQVHHPEQQPDHAAALH